MDIYAVTGQFLGAISRNPKLRTDNDCALFPFYRALHWAAADAFGKVFGIDGDEIDMYLRKQLIVMSEGGVYCDNHVFNRPSTLMPPETACHNSAISMTKRRWPAACTSGAASS